MFQWEKEHLKGVRYNADQYPDDQFLYWGNDWRLVTSYESKKDSASTAYANGVGSFLHACH